MPVKYSVRYLEQADPFNPSSRRKNQLLNLESNEILTPSEITSRIIQKMKPSQFMDVEMTTKVICVEYRSGENRDAVVIFHKGRFSSVDVDSQLARQVWKGRVTRERQNSEFIDTLSWWEKELEFVAVPSTIKDRAMDTYTVTIQFSDGMSPNQVSCDIGHDDRKCSKLS
jgi:hypothetical protein